MLGYDSLVTSKGKSWALQRKVIAPEFSSYQIELCISWAGSIKFTAAQFLLELSLFLHVKQLNFYTEAIYMLPVLFCKGNGGHDG